MPDPVRTEAVKAWIVLRPGAPTAYAAAAITLSAAAEKISLKYIATADKIIAKAGKVRVLNFLCIE